jgi:hypothetical protein
MFQDNAVDTSRQRLQAGSSGSLRADLRLPEVVPSEPIRCLKRGVEVRMRINGWQRLWLLASILWAVVILVLAGILQSDGDQTVPSANVVLFVVRLWIVPVSAVYGFGLGLAWVRRGFQVESK